MGREIAFRQEPVPGLKANNEPIFYALAAGFLLLVLTAALVTGCRQSTPSKNNPVNRAVDARVGFSAPDFTMVDLQGNIFNLSDARGKAVFINFWATT